MERRELALEDDDKKQSKRHAGDGQAAPPACQAEKCTADLTQASKYHLRHKVCERHAKASVVVVSGLRQRFCQQCSRQRSLLSSSSCSLLHASPHLVAAYDAIPKFHELSEFDETKRSCRRRLAGHNERRRKSCSTETPAESSGGTASSSEVQESHCWPAGARSKHFQIR